MVEEATKVRTSKSGEDRRRMLMLIGGEWVEAASGRFLEVANPARRGAVVAEVPRAEAEDVDRACRAAARAFDSWRRTPPQERGAAMLRVADELEAGAEDLT